MFLADTNMNIKDKNKPDWVLDGSFIYGTTVSSLL